MNLEGKVALVTGSGTGIGAAIARGFVASGARVCITGRRPEMLDHVARSLPVDAVVTCAGDVANAEDADRMVGTALEFNGTLDVLVNNAGMGIPGSLVDLGLDDWQRTLDVNLTGPFLLMKAALPHMIKAGTGSIINISFLAGLRGSTLKTYTAPLAATPRCAVSAIRTKSPASVIFWPVTLLPL